MTARAYLKFFVFAGVWLLAQTISRAAVQAPRLIVIVVGDQVRADYLERYHSELSAGGLLRFRDQGNYFLQARQDHAVTQTSPGHVLIGSGLYAAQSGIISNEWYDRGTGERVKASELIPAGPRTRLRWFKGVSLAERIHKAFAQSRVIGVSLKDRAALLLGGPDQDDAYWWNAAQGRFVNYLATPLWLAKFNREMPRFWRTRRRWDLLAPPDEKLKAALLSNGNITRPFVKPLDGLGLDFPHPVSSLQAMMDTPYADDAVERLAERVLDEWKMGQTPGRPDVLAVSFSAVDEVGHVYGPDSLEMYDACLRLDRALARLMAAVQKRVGPEVVWVFCADHGVTPFPELSQARGLAAGRVRLARDRLAHPEWISAVSPPWIYLDRDAIAQSNQSWAVAENQMVLQLSALPGVAAVYTEEELRRSAVPVEIQRSYDRPAAGETGRCGDLWVVLKPGYIFAGGPEGTTHGQPTQDDQHVPLGFYGMGIAADVHPEAVSAGIIAPTLLSRLGIAAPDLLAAVDLSRPAPKGNSP